MKPILLFSILCLVTVICQQAASDEPKAMPKLLFNRDIRPILSEHCFACHGPDKNKRKGKLRLDERDTAIARQAIVPGKATASHLVERIFSQDDAEVMPPAETHKPLSDAQKQMLKRWIEEGAEYQPHWAYIVPTRPSIPAVKNTAWVKTPIDAFILASLEAKRIAPSPEADRATLLRRLSLDLIGLPPTWEEVQAALQAPADQWYEQAVDRLLASPHYGERMAVPWLDLARYADTVGYHGDQNQRIFPYRDYVIDAFNQNMPFDQFTREQLAGDLLPVPVKVATGFNRLNMMTREGGAQPAEYLTKYAADRVRTVAGAWLGSTVGCAECHDHKYDPFTAKDFYSLGAYFSDMKQWGVYQDYGYTPNPDLKGWSNDHPFPPEMEVESKYLKERMAKLVFEMKQLIRNDLRNEAWNPQNDYFRWLKEVRSAESLWTTPSVEVSFDNMPPPAKKKGSTATNKSVASQEKQKAKPDEKSEPVKEPDTAARVLPDRSLLITGAGKLSPTLTLKLHECWLSAIKVELLPHAEHQQNILRTNASTVTFKPTFQFRSASSDKLQPLAIRYADANHKEPIYRNGYDVIGIQEQWRIAGRDKKLNHVSMWLLDQPRQANEADELIITIPTNVFGNIRVSVSAYAPLSLEYLERLSDNMEVDHLRSTGWHPSSFTFIKELEKQYHECRGGKAMTQITEALPKPLTVRVLPRGNFLDQTGPVVMPAPPAFLAKNVGTSRLDLANWLTSTENPLTARVVMNRYWKMLFGNGLSQVLDDVGAQGEWPTHPELLDWLAVEFRTSGWNTKHMHKLMVMSSVYRQSAVTRRELKDVDPNNRLLAAQNPRRLDAEFIRDQALQASGLLNQEMGGPSVFPYQPAGYYSLLQFPDRTYVANHDRRQYRRGLYTHWQRMFLQPMMANFDAPSREECTANRVQANTPQQALTLLNDPSFVEAAGVLAELLLAKPGDDHARLTQAFQRVLSRAPKPAEAEGLLKLLASQRKHYAENPDEATQLRKVGYAVRSRNIKLDELAAWTNVMRVLLNLHEVVTRY